VWFDIASKKRQREEEDNEDDNDNIDSQDGPDALRNLQKDTWKSKDSWNSTNRSPL